MILYDQLYPTIKSGWYKRLKAFTKTFAQYGGNILLIPPPYRTSYVGPDNQSLGYDPVSDLDIGQWDELRGGRASDAQALAQEASRFGVHLMADLPIHQYGGRPPYTERNRDGKPDETLAYKPASLFQGARDDVFSTDGGQAFGVRVTYQTSRPAGYMLKLKLQAIQFLERTLGLFGCRFDAAKDESIATLRALDRESGFDVAEVYSGSNELLGSFFRSTGTPVMDFGSHFAYRAVSQGAGLDALVNYDRFCHANPDGAIIFIDNHDTDGAGGVVNFKGWFYLDAATNAARGWCIYGGDYEVYDLKPLIHNAMWIGTKLAIGRQTYLVVSADVLIWQRDGDGGGVGRSAGVICGISRDPFNTRWVWVSTPWRSSWIENYAVSGGPWVWVHADGRACIPLPPNQYGRADNGVAYSLPGQGGAIQTRSFPLKLADPLDFSGITVRLT